MCQLQIVSAEGFTPTDRAKTVSKLVALKPLGLALSEKQVPQIVENTKKRGELKEPLEPDGMRPRQVRYQAALRPDWRFTTIIAWNPSRRY